jgi:hypothetical protein
MLSAGFEPASAVLETAARPLSYKSSAFNVTPLRGQITRAILLEGEPISDGHPCDTDMW